MRRIPPRFDPRQRGVALGQCPACLETVWSRYPATLVFVDKVGTRTAWAHKECAS